MDQFQKQTNYLKVDLNTIQGKITLGFLLMSVCSIVLGVGAYSLMLHALSEQQEAIQILQSQKTVSQDLSGLLDDAAHVKSLAIFIIFCASVFILFVGFILAVKIVGAVKNKLHKVEVQLQELSKGNLPNTANDCEDELQQIYKEIHNLTVNLAHVKNFAEEVGKGHFDSEVVVFNNAGELGQSLAQMRNSLKEVALEDKRRTWVSEGVALFAQLLRQNNDSLEELCNSVLKELIKYLNANQGAVFIADSQDGETVLDMKACYAYGRRKFLNRTLNVGEGLAGQAYQEGETIFLTEMPKEYFSITSGLGEALPRSVMIVPLKLNENISGVLEIASLHIFEPKDIAFVEKIAESIAATVGNAKVSEETQKLLKDSMVFGEQLRAQEEELRQNLEEIQATQEQMQRQTEEMRKMQDKLLLERSMFHTLMEFNPDRITYKDTESRTLRVNNAKAKRFNLTPEQMIGTTDFDFFPKEHAQKARNEEVELMKVGVPMLDLQERVNFDDGSVIFANTSRIPFKDEQGRLVGVCIISKDITKFKVQENVIEIQDKLLKGILSQVPVFSYKIDKDGNMVSVLQGHLHENTPDVSLLNDSPIHNILPNFAILAEENKGEELFKMSGEVSIGDKKAHFVHYILPDGVYKNVYWGFAVQQ